MLLKKLLPDGNSEDFLSAMYPVINKTGIPAKLVEDTIRYTNIPLSNMTGLLAISARTWQRYKNKGYLSKAVSDKFLVLLQLFSEGEKAFGNFDHFNRWLNSSLAILGSDKPINLLSSFSGQLIIRELIGHIEYGEFS